jgi:hypothetical protein
MGGQNLGAPTGLYANSGYQFEGDWRGFAGTVIGPHAFISATHLGGALNLPFVYQGQTYFTTGNATVPGEPDLVVWYVGGTFSQWAPLYSGNDEVGRTMVVYGHGGPPGTTTSPDGVPLNGWQWTGGPAPNLSWGANIVAANGTVPGLGGDQVTWTIARGLSTGPDTGGLSTGDSGGGVFVLKGGVWYLDGVNSAADGPYNSKPNGPPANDFFATLWDQSNMYFSGDSTPLTGASGSYASRIGGVYDEVSALAGVPEPSSLAISIAGLVVGGPVLILKRRGARKATG